MAKEVTRWLSQDGKAWRTEKKADQHDAELQLLDKIDNELSSGNLEASEILSWIGKNITTLKEHFDA